MNAQALLARKAIPAGERIRVLVVDDSVVIRRLVSHALEEDPAIQVVGSAANGAIALERIAQLTPDVVTLDIEMPEMGDHPQLHVIMFSTLTERGAAVTLEALTLGADDYVAKASNAGSLDRSLTSLRLELIPKIKQFFRLVAEPEAVPARMPARNETPRRLEHGAPRVVAIGVSTGGPTALAQIIPQFPPNFPLPILIVQHMPPLFTRLLAERLQTLTRLKVDEAAEGAPVCPGRVLIAPGDYHMKISRQGHDAVIHLDQSPPENSCRPAVDVLFRSVGRAYGSDAILVVLTGMGQDGLRGVEELKPAGAYVIAQDEASSVVWGMPGAVATAGLADCVKPLERIVPEVLNRVQRGAL